METEFVNEVANPCNEGERWAKGLVTVAWMFGVPSALALKVLFMYAESWYILVQCVSSTDTFLSDFEKNYCKTLTKREIWEKLKEYKFSLIFN